MDIPKGVVGEVLLLTAMAGIVCFAGNQLLFITDPVESNYVETAKEMLASGEYISPMIFGKYWYDKPVFFYWELTAAFSLFGVNEFAARFFPAVFGIAGVGLAYGFTARIYDRAMARTAGLILLTSAEYFFISKAVITDMALFVFFSAAMVAFYIAYSEGRAWLYYAAYGCAGLAVLTKGPIGILQPGLIILLFLWWRRDIRALFTRMKLGSGLLLFFCIIGIWYVPMYVLHGNAFIDQFFGVHNILRATVSEHPKYNVWYYYILIFFLGWVPWCAAVPLGIKKYGGFHRVLRIRRYIAHWHRIPSPDMRQQFLITWAAVIFITYQCMATKYVTYTFPYMIPFAIGFAACLRQYEKEVHVIGICMAAIYMCFTFFVAVPICRESSAYDVAQYVKNHAAAQTCVTAYGGRYPVSLYYYSGHAAKRLLQRDKIQAATDGINWSAKNIMPFMAIEDAMEEQDVMVIVHIKEQLSFKAHMPGNWQEAAQGGKWIVYKKSYMQ